MTAAVEGDEKHHFVCTLLRVKVHSFIMYTFMQSSEVEQASNAAHERLGGI